LVLPLGGNTKQRSSVPISICASQPWGRANSPLSGPPGGGVVSFSSLWVFGLSPENNIFLRRGGQAHCGRAVFPLCCGARAEAKQNLFFVIGAGDWGGSQFNNAQRTVWFVCSLWGVLCKTTHNFAGGQRKQNRIPISSIPRRTRACAMTSAANTTASACRWARATARPS